VNGWARGYQFDLLCDVPCGSPSFRASPLFLDPSSTTYTWFEGRAASGQCDHERIVTVVVVEVCDRQRFGLMIDYPAFSDFTHRKPQTLGQIYSTKVNLHSMQERPVETGCNRFLSVLNIWKWWWTEDRTAVTVLISLENFWSWSVKVQSGLGLFPVLRLDLQTLFPGVRLFVYTSFQLFDSQWQWLVVWSCLGCNEIDQHFESPSRLFPFPNGDNRFRVWTSHPLTNAEPHSSYFARALTAESPTLTKINERRSSNVAWGKME